MSTVIDYSAGVPRASEIRKAGHIGAVRYISPPRADWMLGKPIKKKEADDFTVSKLDWAAVWQYGKEADADVMRGYEGGKADAKAAQQQLEALGAPKKPVFFAVDFDITLKQWNEIAVEYFKGAISVLGKQRVGIYGHSKVCAWAAEDEVIGSAGGGKLLQWQTRAWSNGVRTKTAVLYQRVIDTPSNPAPSVDGITVDVNDVLHDNWGQREVAGGKYAAPTPTLPKKVTTLQPNPKHMGDPLFLLEVLRLWGLTVHEMDGWKSRGQGDFTDIVGVMIHYTGAAVSPDPTPPSIIAYGHSALRGLLSQIHLSLEGEVTLCGAGLAYHAGEGVIPGIGGGYVNQPTAFGLKSFTIGNAKMIGIEAQNSGRQGWSKKQYEAYVTLVAGICWYLGLPVSRVVGHKEYATPRGRKIDPDFDMDQFRADVQRKLDNPPFEIKGEEDMAQLNELLAVAKENRELLKSIHFQLTGSMRAHHVPGHKQLGKTAAGADLSLVDAVAAVRADIQGVK